MGLKYALSAGGVPTSFIAQCVAEGSCTGVWLPPTAVSGNINDADTVLVDVTGTSARVVQAELAVNGNWLWDAADKPTGFATSINTQSNRGQTNYMGIDAALAATSTVIFFGKVQTPQTAGEWVQFGGPTGGFAAPNVDESSFFMWADADTYGYNKGAGTSPPILHGDYTGWFVHSLCGGQPLTGATISQVGGTFGDIGQDSAVNFTGWTGFNAFSGNGVDNHETGTGIVKYAGIAMFSTVLLEATVQGILVNGGILTA
jgi:hypothetical protein